MLPENKTPEIGERPALLSEIATDNVFQLKESDHLSLAAAIMAEKKISSIVVSDADGRPRGIVTEQNVLSAMQVRQPPDTMLSKVMSAPVITVPSDMASQEAYLLCLREGIRHLILVDGQGHVTGVVSETDFRLHLNLAVLAGRRPASSVMSRAVVSLPAEASLREALDHMREYDESCVVIVDKHIPKGIITERDVVRLYRQGSKLEQITLGEVMSTSPVTVILDTPLADVAQRMLEAELRHLVVVDHKGYLAGLISAHELTQVMAFGMVDTQSHADRLFLRTLLDSIPDLIWLKDFNGVYLACNAHFERLFGVSEKEIIGRTDFDFVDHPTAERYQNHDKKTMLNGGVSRNEEWLTFADDGYQGLFETIKTPLHDRGGHLVGILSIARDITERKHAELELEDSRALLNAVVDSTANLIWSVDSETFGLLTFNAGFSDYFQRQRGIKIVKGMHLEDVFAEEELVLRWEKLFKRAMDEGSYTIEYASDIEDLVLQLTFNLLFREGKVFGITVFAEDITARKASEARIEYLAYYDTLTGLPNRKLAQERLKLAMSYASRTDARIALLLLDLDNFKGVNDALGHGVGDELLKSVAARLGACVREADTVSRLGGDDFLILLTDIHDLDDVAAISSKLISTLPEQIEIDGNALSITASVGIAIYPDDAQDMDGLMKKADTALFVVKDSGRNDFRFFDERFNAATVEMLALRNELRVALEKDEFVLYYQPQIDLDSGRLIGAEALIRWQSPVRGLVSPDVFIAVAEESGLIIPIGEWVLKEACRQVAVWRSEGLCDELTIAVNLSAVQFLRNSLEATVLAALEESGLEPQALELELTESILIREPEQVLEIVQRIKRLGVRLSIDDFGTGFSSLSYLQRFPVDKLKIDQSFVMQMTNNVGDAEIVRAIIQMAHALGLKTVAEGIEDETTAHHLHVYHCDEGQGYHFARPLTAEAFAAYMVDRC